MRARGRCFALVVVFLAGTVVSAHHPARQVPKADEKTRTYAKANTKRIECFIALLRLRHDLFLKWKDTGKWPDDREANAALAGHGEYWARQLKEGRATLAGGMKGDYWDNAAIIVFEAETEEKAREIVKNDPAVKAYVFQAQVRPFDVHFITDKYAPAR
jgi:uncharacterized protein YciI